VKKTCPICKGKEINSLFSSDVPVLQNRVYDSIIEAKESTKASVNLTHCNTCNFTFNADFDDSIILYDEKYDNAVPSQIFTQYYKAICSYLYKKYGLENGIIYDIGCGKGTFLNIFCDLYPMVKAIGIDPSYEGDLNPRSNLTFIKDFFKTEHVTDRPSLIISRHVFEHIEFPKEFLELIRNPIAAIKTIPVFIEVPDFGWIVKNKTFWDICYEHCNYFSERSIEFMFNNSWSTLNTITKGFGDQYLWVEGVFNGGESDSLDLEFPEIEKKEITNFIESIRFSEDQILRIVEDYKANDYKIMVWGMATKGVIFTNRIDKENKIIDCCIDINKEKQHKYSPLSAHFIQEPSILKSVSESKCLIIVMNMNYLEEIKKEVSSFRTDTIFIDAHGIEV